jgi:hypothetical protein
VRRAPLEARADPAVTRDDVGHLTRQAWQVQRGAVDDFDSLDVVHRDPLQLIEDVLGLARQTLAVDQHVGVGLAQPSALFSILLLALD